MGKEADLSSESQRQRGPVFLNALNEMKKLAHQADEDFRQTLVHLANQIIESRINSGEAGRSDFVGQLSPAVDYAFGLKTKNPGRYPKILETTQARKTRLLQSYLKVSGTIYEMKSSELLHLIGRLRHELLLFEILSSLPKKSITNLYSRAGTPAP
ncbi:MAG: hypothetical protein OK457_04270 [Thaumarchaeota archaeon]|nr:hypothetical protein [Nitrososphaerota archaeon]